MYKLSLDPEFRHLNNNMYAKNSGECYETSVFNSCKSSITLIFRQQICNTIGKSSQNKPENLSTPDLIEMKLIRTMNSHSKMWRKKEAKITSAFEMTLGMNDVQWTFTTLCCNLKGMYQVASVWKEQAPNFDYKHRCRLS